MKHGHRAGVEGTRRAERSPVLIGRGCGPTLRAMPLDWEQVIVSRPTETLGRGGRRPWLGHCERRSGGVRDPTGAEQILGLLFVRVPEPNTIKNWLHLDLRPVDQEAEVTHVIDLGATYADVGQGDETWVVLADPERNEFCVLASATRLTRRYRMRRIDLRTVLVDTGAPETTSAPQHQHERHDSRQAVHGEHTGERRSAPVLLVRRWVAVVDGHGRPTITRTTRNAPTT